MNITYEKLIKKIFKKFGIEVKRYISNEKNKRVVSLKPEKKARGNVLLSYIIEPFMLKPDEPIPYGHTSFWESFQIAKTFLDLGYNVDVISFINSTFIPKKDYSFFIDTRFNLERLAPLLNKDCIKIMHIDLCHMLYNNTAKSRRLLELQQRRGITLSPQRSGFPNLAIEHADCATMLGNEFTANTFKYANKPIYRIPISQPILYNWSEDKDFEACRRNFLWFGSRELVRKGLDLVLEAFAEMPDYNLTICGPIRNESDFEKVYYKELYQTANIRTIGWTDIGSLEFIEITNRCIGLVFPSSSEGQCGGVVTCLHAGLIPIISYESGVDVDDSFGVILKDCSIDTIKNTVQMISGLPAEKLKLMSRKAWEFARANHTRERFSEEYRKVILKIIDTHHNV